MDVSPEEVLCDAREHLCRELQEFETARPKRDGQIALSYLVENFGDPKEVAEQYGAAEKTGLKIPGYAPGWRICCTRCGNGAPAAKVGITRIGAFSRGKYIVRWCRECAFFRWIKVVKDLDTATLVNRLGVSTTPEELRAETHRPWLSVVAILAFVLGSLFVAQHSGLLAATLQPKPAESMFETMPRGWKLTQSDSVPRSQTKAIGQKFNIELTSLSNSRVNDGKGELQINVARCATVNDAKTLYAAFLKLHTDPRDCIHDGKVVYEFVPRSGDVSSLYAKARYELGMQPKSVRYTIVFDAALIKSGDYTQWNKLFNLFLQKSAGRSVDGEISKLAKDFEFTNSLLLNKSGAGVTQSFWKPTQSVSLSAAECGGDAARLTFKKLKRQNDIPLITIHGIVTSTTRSNAKSDRKNDKSLLQSTKFWPVENAKIKQLADKILSGSKSDAERVEALLAWFGSGMQFKGETGSRHGVEKVVTQKFGHCWDYSDLFVTLCRSAGIPARQVFGWLYESQGHVWCEVLIDGTWQQFDPTTGTYCGSDYVPIVLSEDGRMPLVYASSVKVVAQ